MSGVKNRIISINITDTRFESLGLWPPNYPLSAETINFTPTTLNFHISHYSSCTTDERSKKSNYLGKYERFAFWIFGIISPPKCPLSVETIIFAPTTLNFDIPDYSSCTTDERSKNSNNLEWYHRYAFLIFRITSSPQCPLSVETTNFAPTTLMIDISNYFCTKDERSKKSIYLGKYRRYAFWVFGIILPLKYPLSVKTTDFAPTRLNFNIANYLCTKDEPIKNHIIVENIADTSFASLGLYHPQIGGKIGGFYR